MEAGPHACERARIYAEVITRAITGTLFPEPEATSEQAHSLILVMEASVRESSEHGVRTRHTCTRRHYADAFRQLLDATAASAATCSRMLWSAVRRQRRALRAHRVRQPVQIERVFGSTFGRLQDSSSTRRRGSDEVCALLESKERTTVAPRETKRLDSGASDRGHAIGGIPVFAS